MINLYTEELFKEIEKYAAEKIKEKFTKRQKIRLVNQI